MKCPNCGAEASGKFCSACGASLQTAACAQCGASLMPGARFCNQCGTAVARGGARGGTRRTTRSAATVATGSNLPWYLLAGVLVIVIVALALPMIMKPEADPAPLAPGGAMGTGTPPPLTGTPREQADRLFNRIMTAQDQGDTANAKFFAPMGIDAYRMAEPLDADGLYHLAVIHNVAGDFASGRATAERILATNPNHLLGLAAAAEAAERAGDQAAARNYYQRFVSAYDAENARGLPEYQDHARILPEHLAAARRATAR